jgi:hypothetical protein
VAISERKASSGINIAVCTLILMFKLPTMKKLSLLLLLVITFVTTNAQTTDKTPVSLKYDFFSPVAGCFGFSLEKPRSNFTSMDYDAGLIGFKLGDYYLNDEFIGGYVSAGPRLYFDRDPRELNDMMGLYFKPQLLASYFNYKYETVYYDPITFLTQDAEVSGSDFSLSLLMCMGTQWILSDLIVFDLWFGLGYGGNWINEETNIPPDSYYEVNNFYKYSHIHFGDNSPMVFDGGLSIGLVF